MGELRAKASELLLNVRIAAAHVVRTVNAARPRCGKCGEHQCGTCAQIGDLRLSSNERGWPRDTCGARINDLHLCAKPTQANEPFKAVFKDRLFNGACARGARQHQAG